MGERGSQGCSGALQPRAGSRAARGGVPAHVVRVGRSPISAHLDSDRAVGGGRLEGNGQSSSLTQRGDGRGEGSPAAPSSGYRAQLRWERGPTAMWRKASADPYRPLQALMDACGGTMPSLREFYWEVNRAYHAAEAPVYEQIHLDMVHELPTKWARLVSPLSSGEPRSLRWLDVGCGTGLVGSILSGLIGHRIGQAVLLDPSEAMIEQCKRRVSSWGVGACLAVGTIESLAARPSFDLITVNSVLHHVAELDQFCQHVSRMLRPGGYFITCQDPRAKSWSDVVFVSRRSLARSQGAARTLRYRMLGRLPRTHALTKVVRSLRPRRESLRVLDTATGVASPDAPPDADAVIRATNDELLRRGVIGRALSPQEVWAVTDFHVPGQPGRFGAGIALTYLTRHLDPLRVEDYFTYNFFGYAGQTLPDYLVPAENTLFQRSDRHGMLFASRWRKS